MKAFIATLFLLIAVAHVRSHPPPELKAHYDQCKKDNGITEDLGDSLNVEDKKVKCFLACMMTKMGKMADGKVILEKEMEYISMHFPNADENLKKKVTECTTKANELTDQCEAAAIMYKCTKDKTGEPLN
uniref:Odorant-binding protein 35 n=1 Tax=Encarsia formosa TaxID=32400 RepID=A0A514TTZ0_ENCFO|nr:odorant-binding protein 35 [Encarsia formosa]